MATSGKSNMSLQKHRGSGWKNGAGKSPKLREHMKREAKNNDRKAPKSLPHGSVTDAFKAQEN